MLEARSGTRTIAVLIAVYTEELLDHSDVRARDGQRCRSRSALVSGADHTEESSRTVAAYSSRAQIRSIPTDCRNLTCDAPGPMALRKVRPQLARIHAAPQSILTV